MVGKILKQAKKLLPFIGIIIFFYIIFSLDVEKIIAAFLKLDPILIIFALIVGYLLGGPKKSTKRTMALSTIARNAAVASMVVISNFPTYDQALIMVLVFSILYVIIGILVGILWKRHPIDKET